MFSGTNIHVLKLMSYMANLLQELEFRFLNSNHSVVRAAFEAPCQPFDFLTEQKDPTFFSGFKKHDSDNGDVSFYRRINALHERKVD
jgi:hypothetical protein